MSAGKVALIAGSTGLVGRELLLLLLESSEYRKVIALVRKKTSYRHEKLTEIETDFDRLKDFEDYFKGTDDVFCCLGTTMKNAGSKEAFRKVDYDYPVALAALAEKMSSKGFFCISAMGANIRSKVFYNRVKGQMEEKVRSMHIPCITFFRPSLLVGFREEVRRGERIAIAIFKALAFLFWGPLKNMKAIPASKVAVAMFRAADKKKNGVFTVYSGEMQ